MIFLYKKTKILILAVLAVVCLPCLVSAKLSASLELDYGHYDAEVDGVSTDDSDHFAQRYGLIFTREGLFLDGRGGGYELMLGGEFTDLDTALEINSQNSEVDIETSKLLYNGDISFAPGGLPFRIHLYSRDNSQAHFTELGSGGSFFNETLTGFPSTVLDPQILIDIRDGFLRQSGVSLVAGIRNGSYLGKYRNVLSSFPKIYVDFTETYAKDTKAQVPTHYKDRELAFVSLNKKHNWFHYRFYDHRDFLNPAENTELSIYTVGNIDHLLRREWINLTNWIKISADVNYIEEDNPQIDRANEKSYAINLFAETDRKNWNSSTFAKWRRTETEVDLERSSELPVFASGSINRDSSWRSRFIYNSRSNVRPFELVNNKQTKNDVYADLGFDLYKTRSYQVSPSLEVERKLGDFGEGHAARLGAEVKSNNRIITTYDILADIKLAYFEAEDDVGVGSIEEVLDYWEVESTLQYTRYLSPTTSAGFLARVLVGDGVALSNAMDRIQPNGIERLNGMTTLAGEPVKVDGQVSRGDLEAFFEKVSNSGARNRLEAGAKYISEIERLNTPAQERYFLSHRLDYSRKFTDYSFLTRLTNGDNIGFGIQSQVFDVSNNATTFDGNLLQHNSTARYQPNPSWNAGLRFALTSVVPESNSLVEDAMQLRFRQGLSYIGFRKIGRREKLFDVKEYFEYEDTAIDNSNSFEAFLLGLKANYYPTRWARVGAKVQTQNDLANKYGDIGYGLYGEVNFSKLSAGVEYEYGMRDADSSGSVQERKEQRWQVNIKKTF